ncbi:hypothetical protein ACIQAL_17490 [Pseudomonas sp. NPDC088368]|jgi:hypothetical protein|uniref:hypothetical protein n=1 Tax=Pseudomonas sp. NPDC088368 TaxID=3364453 RepID=UPI00380F9E38
MNNEQFLNHISTAPSLNTIPPAATSRSALKDDAESAVGAVVGQGVIGFVAGMSQQAREDVLDTFTYATLAADKRHDIKSEKGEWYKTFREVMVKALNWAPQDSAFVSSSSSERVITMGKLGVDLVATTLAAAATGGVSGAAMLQAAGNAVEALKDNDEPIRLFNRRTHKPGVGSRFMVGGCTESEDGVIALAVGAIEAKTEASEGNFLFVNWNAVSVEMNRSADVFVFHQSIYAQRRENVRQKLLEASDAAFLEFAI